jgi:hypothetical protein
MNWIRAKQITKLKVNCDLTDNDNSKTNNFLSLILSSQSVTKNSFSLIPLLIKRLNCFTDLNNVMLTHVKNQVSNVPMIDKETNFQEIVIYSMLRETLSFEYKRTQSIQNSANTIWDSLSLTILQFLNWSRTWRIDVNNYSLQMLLYLIVLSFFQSILCVETDKNMYASLGSAFWVPLLTSQRINIFSFNICEEIKSKLSCSLEFYLPFFLISMLDLHFLSDNIHLSIG